MRKTEFVKIRAYKGAKRFNIAKNYLFGRLRCAEFAITNSCIAQCTFCDIWKQRPKVFTDKEKTLESIDRLAAFGVSHLTLTGGEPLLHPHIIDFVKRASDRKMNTAALVAAPRLVARDGVARELEQAGCDLLSMSLDSGDPAVMDASRNISGFFDEMEDAMREIKRTGIKTMASVLIWNNNHNKLKEVCERAIYLGFDFVSLNYPTFSQSGVYELGGEGVSLSREELIAALKDAIELKRLGKYGIINSVVSMNNIIDYLEDPDRVRFLCKGGKRVMFVDWYFDVRPCMQLPDVLGSVLTMSERDLDLPPCNKCNMSWYRDFSTLFSGVKSLPALFEGLSKSGGLI